MSPHLPHLPSSKRKPSVEGLRLPFCRHSTSISCDPLTKLLSTRHCTRTDPVMCLPVLVLPSFKQTLSVRASQLPPFHTIHHSLWPCDQAPSQKQRGRHPDFLDVTCTIQCCTASTLCTCTDELLHAGLAGCKLDRSRPLHCTQLYRKVRNLFCRSLLPGTAPTEREAQHARPGSCSLAHDQQRPGHQVLLSSSWNRTTRYCTTLYCTVLYCTAHHSRIELH